MADPDKFYKAKDMGDADDTLSYDEDSPYGTRRKGNATGTYVYNIEGSAFMFKVVGCSQEGGGVLYQDDTLKPGRIDQGCRRRIRQYVYENGHALCMLWAASIYNNSSSTGNWSPDSVGSDPYCND